MTRGSLGFIATILAGLMVVVGTAGLDDLPRPLRTSVAGASAQLQADRSRFEDNRNAILKAEQDEPALFANQAATIEARLAQDRARLDQAAVALSSLDQLAKPNRRSDSEKVERALRKFDSLRAEPVSDSSALKADAEKAVYDKLHPFDKDAATAPVRKAMVDWPDKGADLQSRLESVHDAATADSLNTLAAQLYVSWDKLLLHADGSRQRIRLVRTRSGESTSEERTEARQSGIGPEAEGLVIEHKDLGKYETESERTVQHPTHAYIAPPGQSNRYGHWTNGVWEWLPAYIILSHMLHSSRAPITTRDYEGWHDAYRRGIPPPVIGGSAPRPSMPPTGGLRSPGGQQSSSGWWKERPKETPKAWGGSSGGSSDHSFGSSQYRSRGGYSGSKYQSKGTFRSFGKGRR